ncbi:MAG TPA: tRNA epoxyqueuosine(34) reductase QueG [Parachlamydiaceae bacterium]|nr:tRNA epoxyqueuosine(34) reductase QueG [Parachlamydiaceae bacterium]
MVSFNEIKAKALELGFDDVGITLATVPQKDIEAYQKWLQKGWHGNLHYMENEIRCFPEELFPGAKTAIIFVSYYKQEKIPFEKNKGIIASYARGRDYHLVHRKRLKKFILWLEDKSGQKGIAKGFSDSSPVLEKALAVQAGLGWIGKNSLLIHRRFGTFTLLSGLFTSLEIENPKMELSLAKCGSCSRCMDACPTSALSIAHQVNANLCLSYHLIESKKEIPEEIQKKNPGYIFGCDICQDVCPHNARKAISLTADFTPSSGIGGSLDAAALKALENSPEKLFGTPLQRRKVAGLKKNGMLLSL